MVLRPSPGLICVDRKKGCGAAPDLANCRQSTAHAALGCRWDMKDFSNALRDWLIVFPRQHAQVRGADGAWRDIQLTRNVKALVLLNLQSYGGGRDLWGVTKSRTKNPQRRWQPPIFDDGLIEVSPLHAWLCVCPVTRPPFSTQPVSVCSCSAMASHIDACLSAVHWHLVAWAHPCNLSQIRTCCTTHQQMLSNFKEPVMWKFHCALSSIAIQRLWADGPRI